MTRNAIVPGVLLLVLIAGATTASACCCMMGMGGRQDMDPHRDMGAGAMDREEGRSSAGERQAEAGGYARCPVDGMKVRITEDTPATEFRGKTYYFCDETEQREFLRRPERYAAT